MYVIVAYDIGVDRLDGVRQVLKQYLNWIQNSAFEGELSEGKLEELRLKVKEMIAPEVDSVVFFKISNPTWVSKVILGREKGAVGAVL
mgnify:CR=1 FL=1